MMLTTKQATREAKQLFRLCLVDGTLDAGRVRQVVTMVLQSRHRGHRTLFKFFRRLVKLECDRHTARVESAVPLPAELATNVKKRVRRVYGPGLTTFFSDNPDLIGGMRIQVGSDVYDGSIRSRLAALERSFLLAGANGSNGS